MIKKCVFYLLAVFALAPMAHAERDRSIVVDIVDSPLPMRDVSKGLADPMIDIGSILLRVPGQDSLGRIVDNVRSGNQLVPQQFMIIRSSSQATVPLFIEIQHNGQSVCEGEVEAPTNTIYSVNCANPVPIITGTNSFRTNVFCEQFAGSNVNTCDTFATRAYDTRTTDPIDHRVNDVYLRNSSGQRVDDPEPGQFVLPSINLTIEQANVYYFAIAIFLNDSPLQGCFSQFPFDQGRGPITVTVDCPFGFDFPADRPVDLTGFVDPADETDEVVESNNSFTRTYEENDIAPPVVVDGVTLERLILPDQPPGGARYGQVVALEGDQMVCGVPGFTQLGVAVFNNTPDGQVFDSFLQPPAGFAVENFGSAVSFDDGLLVVGAPSSSTVNAKGNDLQAALFERANAGGLNFKQPLTASFGRQPGDQFGAAIAVSADTILVGAPEDDEGETQGNGSGAVYVFANENGNFNQIAKMKPGNPSPGLGFGSALAIDGNQMVVAGPGNVGQAVAGSADILERVGNNLNRLATIAGNTADADEFFGASVSIDNDNMLIGAPGNDDAGSDAGAVYQFEIDGNSVAQTGMLMADNPESGAQYGAQVKLKGLEALVGAPGETGTNGTSGAVYRYLNDQLQQRLEALGSDAEEANLAGFGAAIDLEEGQALLGAPDTNGARGGASSATGLTKAERNLSPLLEVDTSFGCPGFFIGRVQTMNSATGRWSMEIQLPPDPGPLLQGGLVFGGGFGTPTDPGFSAFNVMNRNDEPQRIIGTMEVARPEGMTYRVEVVRRQGGDQTVIFSEESSATLFNFETTINPGFHSIRIFSTNTVGGLTSGTFNLQLNTQFVDRAGGGFFGGAVAGGLMATDSPSDTDTGFVAFCIAEEQEVDFTTFGKTEFGNNGVDSLRLDILDRDRELLFSDPE